jgi:hypothetical protein
LEFGRKRYGFALAFVEMCQNRIDGLLQVHYVQLRGRLRNPRKHNCRGICMGQLGLDSWRDQDPSIQAWKNIGCLDKYEVVQRSRVSNDRLHLQAELPVRLAIPFNVFQCVFQFDPVALQKGIDFHPS